ncbi:MAG: ATP-binding protein [Candidatus Omnitrophota bacterium]
MINTDTIIYAIKRSPYFYRDFFIQPSKIYNFITECEKNRLILVFTCFFSGLILGGILAVPHYYFYKDLWQSILFAIAIGFSHLCAAAFTVFGIPSLCITGGIVLLMLLMNKAIFIFALSGAIAGTAACTVEFGGPFASTGIIFGLTIIGANLYKPDMYMVEILLLLSEIHWIILFWYGKYKPRVNEIIASIAFFASWFAMTLSGGMTIQHINPYETVIYPLAFFLGYSMYTSLNFIEKSIKFKADFFDNKLQGNENSIQKSFEKNQKTSLLWGPIISILLFVPYYFTWESDLHTKLIIPIMGFTVMPIFILNIPNYLLCLISWYFQKKKLLNKYGNSEKLSQCYEQSVLFNHEQLYFQLPGLAKIMIFFAKRTDIGIQEAVKRIDYLYWFTFQRKQVRKAIFRLAQEVETSHQYIHFLLESNNRNLIETLVKKNRMAELYLSLFEPSTEKVENTDAFLILPDSKSPYVTFHSKTLKTKDPKPQSLVERIKWVCSEMSKIDCRFTSEMVETLEKVQKLLNAENIWDITDAITAFEGVNNFPSEITYFAILGEIVPQLKRVKEALPTIQSIERFETRRTFLSEQIEVFETLSKTITEKLYEPFKSIWKITLRHCSKLVAMEIQLLQGSASLSIRLKNNNILVSMHECKLYFEIQNTGQELATNICMAIRSSDPILVFTRKPEEEINVIESGSVREICFSISTAKPGKSVVFGTLTFSDSARKAKTVNFSFPVTLLEKRSKFKEIKNPYIVGQPLRGDNSLFYGREDAYKFIDQSIMASGTHHTIVCHGLRRSGKTSLLYRIETQGFSNKRLIPINVDMQGIQDEADFYYTLSSAIKEKFDFNLISEAKSFSEFKRMFKEIKTQLDERIIVLMIDEFEELQMHVEEKRASKTIFSNIRHLMQHEQSLIFLFCGTHKLEEMSDDYWSIFFNTALYVRINQLKTRDAIRLIKEPVKDLLIYDDLAIEQILKMTGGQPYLIQLVCRTLVNDLNEKKKKNDALINDVDDAVQRIILEGDDHLSQHIWQQSNSLERLVLSAAASEMTRRQLDNIGTELVYDKVQALMSKYSRRQVMEALDTLVAKDILTENLMLYRFPFNLFRQWIVAHYPPGKIREEINNYENKLNEVSYD